jgi:hypothetical protein
MNQSQNIFTELANRAGKGDLAAKNQLHNQLEHQMVHIVRLTLRKRNEQTSLDRHIIAEARRRGLGDDLESREDRDELLRMMAHDVCAWVMARLRPVQQNRIATEDTARHFPTTANV